MAATLSEVLGKTDVIEDCRKQLRLLCNKGNVRVTAELQLKNGDRRIYRAKNIDKNSAIQEILMFVGAVEKATGDSVLWRLKGDKTYHLGTSYSSNHFSIKGTVNSVINYFFGLEA